MDAGAEQPTITVLSPLDKVGVRLLPFESPEFQAALPSDRDKKFDYLLHYSAMLSDNTDQSIIAYTILWNCTDSTGKVRVSEDAWFNFSAFPSARHLSAHRSKFVSVLTGDSFDSPRVFSEAPEEPPMFTKQKSVEIVLSAVLFADGTAVGDDARGWISRWSAFLSAQQDVISAAASSPPGKLRELMTQYIHSASNIAKPVLGRNDEEGDLGYDSFFSAATITNTFAEQYALKAGCSAAMVLRRLDRERESDLRVRMQGFARMKYPQVKKREF